MKSRTWIIVLILLLLVSNAYWVYNTIDFGVSYTYLEASAEHASKRAEQAMQLANLNLIGLDADEAQALLRNDVVGLEAFEKEGCMWVGGICLRLDSERKIVRIEGIDL